MDSLLSSVAWPIRWSLPAKGSAASQRGPTLSRTENNKTIILSKTYDDWRKKCKKHTFVLQPTERKGQEMIESGQSFLVWFPIWKKSSPKYMYMYMQAFLPQVRVIFFLTQWLEQNKCISLMLYDNINSIRMHCSEQRLLYWQINKTTQAVNNINHK